MSTPQQETSPFQKRILATGEPLLRFSDSTQVSCSVYRTKINIGSVASPEMIQAVWFGTDEIGARNERDTSFTPRGVLLPSESLKKILVAFEQFVTKGALSDGVVTMKDLNGVPCCIAVVQATGANDKSLLIGPVLPREMPRGRAVVGLSRERQSVAIYFEPDTEVSSATQLMFDRLRQGDAGMVDVDNRIVLSQELAAGLADRIATLVG